MWNSGRIAFALGSNPSASDVLSLSGSLSGPPGQKLFTFQDNGWAEGVTYDLIVFSNSCVNISDFGYTNGGGFAGIFSYNLNKLQFTMIPEPSVWTLVLAAGFSLIVFRRKRHQAPRNRE